MKKSAAALFVLAILAGQGVPGVSLGADLPLKPPPSKPKSVEDFGKLGADCIAATDGCRGYVRATDGKFDATGNIGIACQPKPLACTKRR